MAKIKVKDDLDLYRIADSGQCFRWETLPVLGDEPAKYRIPAFGKCLIVSQPSKDCIETDCTEEEFGDLWYDYLDLGTSYKKIRTLVDKDEDPFMADAAASCVGLRILRQDPWETLISFIISQNRNIPAIKRSIELLCERAGKRCKDSEGNAYYSFPGPEDILSLSDEKLSECRLGYRDVYLRNAARTVTDGDLDLDAVSEKLADEAISELMKIKGVGLKVASCVTLFGLHKLDAFPVDVWIKRVLENEYPNGYPKEKYSPYNGVYQQYMFEYYRKKDGERK